MARLTFTILSVFLNCKHAPHPFPTCGGPGDVFHSSEAFLLSGHQPLLPKHIPSHHLDPCGTLKCASISGCHVCIVCVLDLEQKFAALKNTSSS